MAEDMERPRRAKGEGMADYRQRREGYVAHHRSARSGNARKLGQLEEVVGWLVEPGEADTSIPSPGDILHSPAPPETDERDDEIDRLKAENEELRNRPPVVVEKIVHVAVPAPVVEPPPPPEPTAPYVPDFTLIPDALAKYAESEETAADFRARLKLLWQRFGIETGENFPGGGEALAGDEKISMREIDILLNSDKGKNAGLLQWLFADEHTD